MFLCSICILNFKIIDSDVTEQTETQLQISFNHGFDCSYSAKKKLLNKRSPFQCCCHISYHHRILKVSDVAPNSWSLHFYTVAVTDFSEFKEHMKLDDFLWRNVRTEFHGNSSSDYNSKERGATNNTMISWSCCFHVSGWLKMIVRTANPLLLFRKKRRQKKEFHQNRYPTPYQRTWQISTSTQLHEMLYTDSQHLVLLPAIIA
jgi:hypothetical protein